MPKYSSLAGILLFGWVIPAYAVKATSVTLTTKHAELKTVQSKILAIDKNIDHLQAQQQAIQRQVAELEKKIGLQALALRDLQVQIEQKRQDISNTEKNINLQIDRINQQKRNLKDQILASYHIGQHDRLKLLLNSEDPVLAGRLLVYYDYLNKMRIQKVTQIEADVKQLAILQDQQEQAIDDLNQDLERKQIEQKQFVETKQLRAVALLQLHNELLDDKNLLNRLKSNERALKFLIGKLQQESEDFDNSSTVDTTQGEQELNSGSKTKLPAKWEKLNSRSPDAEPDLAEVGQNAKTVAIKKSHTEFDSKDSGKNFSQLKGRLTWPAAGKVHITESSAAAEDKRNGVLIEAPEGNPVRAVAKGKIAFAGWMRGYGMLTIVNHGDGYMTVYAFNQSLYKKVGDLVKAGEIIASVGQSGEQNRVGLYFEIRKRGLPLNPVSWCKK